MSETNNLILTNTNKIKEYKIGERGNGKIIAIPQVWAEDNFGKDRGEAEMYRAEIEGSDCLIIKRKNVSRETKKSSK